MAREIFFATSNAGKVVTLQRALERYGIGVIQRAMGLPEPQSADLREVAKTKALFAWQALRKPCVVLDAGFFVPALNDFPGAFSKFVLATIGIEGILRLVEGKDRACQFRNALAYVDERLGWPEYFESVVPGTLAEFPRGTVSPEAWSRLWLVFVPEGEKKTLGEMTPAEFADWRARRLNDSFAAKFAEWLSVNRVDKPSP